MPKLKVNRTPDFLLQTRIRGEMQAQNVTIEQASRYAGCCIKTLYALFDEPTKYWPQTLRLLRNLSVPIEDVRAAITYPW